MSMIVEEPLDDIDGGIHVAQLGFKRSPATLEIDEDGSIMFVHISLPFATANPLLHWISTSGTVINGKRAGEGIFHPSPRNGRALNAPI